MEDIIDDLLIEIFDYFDYRDLCSVRLTCRKFNDIISNSATLMDKFRIKIANRKTDFKLPLIGNYRRIKVSHFAKNYQLYLEQFGVNILDIDIRIKSFNFGILRKVLNACPNVKHLTIKELKIEYSADDYNEPLPKLNFDTLDIDDFDGILLKFLLECSVKKLALDIHDKKSNATISKQFLKKQKNLEVLELKQFNNQLMLFNDTTLNEVDFKLKKLIIKYTTLTSFNTENLKKFLENQKSLNEVIIKRSFYYRSADTELINTFSDLKSIKKLYLENFKFDHQPMPYIETLTIDGYTVKLNFCEKYPNVKNLTLIDCEDFKFVENFTNRKMSNDSSDSSDDSNDSDNFSGLKIPKVKTLKLKKVIFSGDNPFEYDDVKIENLIIDDCGKIDWLIDCFRSNKLKLNLLKIQDTKIKKSQQEYLEKLQRKKIKELKIHIPMKSNEEKDFVFEYRDEIEKINFKRSRGGCSCCSLRGMLGRRGRGRFY